MDTGHVCFSVKTTNERLHKFDIFIEEHLFPMPAGDILPHLFCHTTTDELKIQKSKSLPELLLLQLSGNGRCLLSFTAE